MFDPPHALGWRTGHDPHGDGRLEFGGWFWRYALRPLGPSETQVTHTYDWWAVPDSVREYLHFPPFGPKHLPNSLQHLVELTAARPEPPPDSLEPSARVCGVSPLRERSAGIQ